MPVSLFEQFRTYILPCSACSILGHSSACNDQPSNRYAPKSHCVLTRANLKPWYWKTYTFQGNQSHARIRAVLSSKLHYRWDSIRIFSCINHRRFLPHPPFFDLYTVYPAWIFTLRIFVSLRSPILRDRNRHVTSIPSSIVRALMWCWNGCRSMSKYSLLSLLADQGTVLQVWAILGQQVFS